MVKGRCEYLEMLQPNESAEEFVSALDKGFQFIASHIGMLVGSIDDEEGLAIIRMLKASPFTIDDQAELTGFIDKPDRRGAWQQRRQREGKWGKIFRCATSWVRAIEVLPMIRLRP